MSKKKKELFDPSKVEKLNIPEDEIWTYEIEGLQKPRIVNKTTSLKTKIGIIIILIIAISLSLFMSIKAVSNKEFKFEEAENGVKLVKFTNVENKKEVTVDFANGESTMPITEIHEYAFNCDEVIETVFIGKDVKAIDGKSFFSCKALRNIIVDDENPYYCDIDGVLYNKDCSRVICWPISHSLYLTERAGFKLDFPADGSITAGDFRWAVKLLYDCDGDESKLSNDDKGAIKKFTALTGITDYKGFISKYKSEVSYYKIPETVTKIGKLAFAYADIYKIDMPEGIREFGVMAFFRMDYLCELNTYSGDKIYPSLPDGLESIGADCFSFDRELDYMFIPSSVKEIGHHAFYNTCWKDNGNPAGIKEMNIGLSEAEFEEKVETGENWLPKYDAGLFKKSVNSNYSAVRQAK